MDIVIYMDHIKIIGQTLLVKNVIRMFIKIIANNELNVVGVLKMRIYYHDD